MTAAYVIVETSPALTETPCGAKRCQTLIPEGAPVTLVYHEARFIRDPDGPDVQARLCGDCAGRLGANARAAVLDVVPKVAEPFMYRGKPVPAW